MTGVCVCNILHKNVPVEVKHFSKLSLFDNGYLVRGYVALFALMALILSGLHAGPVAAHGNEGPSATADFHDHGHVHVSHGEDPNDGDASPDLNSEQGHHHSPSGPAPQVSGSDLELHFTKQVLFASEASLLHSGSSAPPLDPPIA
jgi:hypothetical protein